MEQIEGVVQRVVYAAPDGTFAVVRLEVAGRNEPVTAIGALGDATPGEHLKLEGTWERHPQFGEQLRVSRAVVELPRTPEGVQRYLEGLRGIGPELARRLVTAFGEKAVEVVESEPWRAAQVKGMGKRRAEAAAREAAEKRQEREVMIFLQGLGVSLAYAARIRKVYGAEAVQKVRENPYRLARDVPGIGFFVADRIARGMGVAPDSPLRIAAGVLHTLETLVDEGHCYAPAEALVLRANEMLQTDRAAEGARALVAEGALLQEGEALYLPRLYRAEVELARGLQELLAAPRPPPVKVIQTGKLSAEQERAVEAVGKSGVVVVTGGPGTGKTTIVRTLVASWERARRSVLLAAPTGRAAKRLSEATGRPAQTVHRLLEWGRPGKAATVFGRDAQNQLDCDLLVVDEASMLDLPLARALVAAIPRSAALVLVGDVDQLPSVGPGQILADVIGSGVVEVARLTEVFRQAEGSGIVDNAYRILGGEMPVGDGKDFYVVRADEPEKARELVVRMCAERIPKAFGFDPKKEVQVLSPMHRGVAGTESLNQALQAGLNPNGEPIALRGRTLRVGDKVMQLRNDYDRDVFNGDLGMILRVQPETDDEEAQLDVDFDGRIVRYDGDAAGDLDLAYAISVHKSQGSEYPAVVIPLLPAHHLLLKRNLLYTAVTRGKKLVVLVGAERAIRRAVGEADTAQRWTGLRARLARPV